MISGHLTVTKTSQYLLIASESDDCCRLDIVRWRPPFAYKVQISKCSHFSGLVQFNAGLGHCLDTTTNVKYPLTIVYTVTGGTALTEGSD